MEAGEAKVLARLEAVEASQIILRVDLMARMDRLGDQVTAISA